MSLATFTFLDSTAPVATSIAAAGIVPRVGGEQARLDETAKLIRWPPSLHCHVAAAGVTASAVHRRRAAHRRGSQLFLRAAASDKDAAAEVSDTPKDLKAEASDKEVSEDAAEVVPKGRSTDSRKKVVPFDPAAQVGVTEPLGFFDPLGFCPPGDPGNFRNLRSAELKHGRVAMLATVGFVAQHFFRIPGFEEAPAGIKAIEPLESESGLNIVPSVYGFWFLVAVAPIFEYNLWRQDINKEPGDFGDPLGLGMYDEDMRNRELNNGRFAMFASIGIIAAELVSGRDAIQQLGFS
mmetsp:Transcript_41221/g.74532  ORF Transcript_41221/g.74532 Transcript_41221/m.74532 type:complete len:294 (-) Transcript_41221:61-942(-)